MGAVCAVFPPQSATAPHRTLNFSQSDFWTTSASALDRWPIARSHSPSADTFRMARGTFGLVGTKEAITRQLESLRVQVLDMALSASLPVSCRGLPCVHSPRPYVNIAVFSLLLRCLNPCLRLFLEAERSRPCRHIASWPSMVGESAGSTLPCFWTVWRRRFPALRIALICSRERQRVASWHWALPRECRLKH